VTNLVHQDNSYRDTRIAQTTPTMRQKLRPRLRFASPGHIMLRLLRPLTHENPMTVNQNTFLVPRLQSGSSLKLPTRQFLYGRTPFTQQHLLTLLPGRYGQVSTFRNTLKSNNEDSYYFFISVLHIEYYKSLLPKLLHAWSIYE
jgi:hypothetical protein